MSKNHRSGGKFGGDHTTLIDPAVILADAVNHQPEVTRIVAGFITPSKGGGASTQRVKIVDCPGGVLLTIRQSGTVQEVRIITKDPQATKLAVARAARNRGMQISFGKKEEIQARQNLLANGR